MSILLISVRKGYAPTYAPLGGRQGPYLPSADSSDNDLKRGELRFMVPKVMRTSGARIPTRMHS